jgi:uracil-DNA glycosylase
MDEARYESLAAAVRRCRICIETPRGRPLPHEPRPVIRGRPGARILIAGQAPGVRVHASGIPFSDRSGERLRDWMGVDEASFYDETRIAILPMGFCFPGLDAKGGDLPPRRECAPAWRQKLLDRLGSIRLVLAIGIYAQRWHLGSGSGALTETVADWRSILSRPGLPSVLPLPHPSWRNNAWIRRHPWFEDELLPELRRRVEAELRAAD